MKQPWKLVVLIGIFSSCYLTHAQVLPPGEDPGGGANPPPAEQPEGPSPGRTLVDLEIQHIGILRLELFDRDKPLSARNFLRYIFSGAYSNSFLHRASSNFVVQGGSLRVISFGSGSKAVAPVSEFDPIASELGVGRFFSNVRGTLALAHENGLPDEATCHWFINLADNTWLDAPDTNHSYTVFGRVISGLDLLDKLNPASPSSGVTAINLGGWLEELPVPPGVTALSVTYNDLLTTRFKIAALDMDMRITPLPDGTKDISWQSVSNSLHAIEFTSALETLWQTLWTTNGTGGLQSVTDSNPGEMRIYRLKYE